MGIHLYTLTGNADYTLCIEILNGDYKLWHKTKVSIDRATSHGLTIGNVTVKKFSYKYKEKNNIYRFMYYDRLIVNVKKTAQSLPYILDILVDIPQVGDDLITYPKNFTNNYINAYGNEGQVPDVDADKVYDYHTAFDIKPTEVSYNVDINANQNSVRNIKLERD